MNRRDMIRTSIAGGLGATALGPAGLAAATRPTRPTRPVRRDPSDQLQEATLLGIEYFRQRCDDQLPTVVALHEAIQGGDLEAARRAYVEARPPYEEIETIAGCFEESDADIDARPYSFEGGETDPEFRGFHRIENLIFAADDVESARPYSEQLVASIKRLRAELDEEERFSPEGQFDGMVALTNEVAAKKVSSEEETWSDQSVLIFKHNWIGAHSQFLPFGMMHGRDRPSVKAVNEAFNDAQVTVQAYFTPGIVAAAPYSSVPIRQRRAIADASNRYRDAIIVVRDELGISG